ncbi:hypothetical protein HJC23_005930 [Cyclotella cryptica]|uniref:Uncharacterized protein n=1 Tax=Cyclotella cryptica TaxID=29204 RepID=A0ABD3R256_9STRA|eukprot:CCRYP_000493-RA/>CCRYP_000493-RA protein AED:0.26 eAED:0.26 QI:0/-1/0/1/-1/1/1/0/226
MASQPSLLPMTSSFDKVASSSYSPTTVFAVDDLHSVFRAADGRGLMQAPSITEGSVSALAKRRNSPNSSFMTDEEFSTFSEDDDEDSGIVTQSSFGIPLPRSGLSIFRPISGNKRPHRLLIHPSSDDDLDIVQKDVFSRSQDKTESSPVVCRANPIRSNDSDDDSSSSSCKRIRRTPSSSFSDNILSSVLPSTEFRLTPQYLHHPLSFEAWSKANCSGIETTTEGG